MNPHTNYIPPAPAAPAADSVNNVSYPTSVRHRMEHDQLILEQQQRIEAETMVRATGNELARTAPERLTILMAGQAGFKEIVNHETNTIVDVSEHEMRLFGIKIGSEKTTNTRQTTYSNTWEIRK